MKVGDDRLGRHGPTPWSGSPAEEHRGAACRRRSATIDGRIHRLQFSTMRRHDAERRADEEAADEQQVDVVIGPSGSPNAMGTLQFIAEAKTPMLAPVGTPAVVLPMDDQKRWVFKTTQNDSLISEALVAHMAKTGIKTVGLHRPVRRLRRVLVPHLRADGREGGHQAGRERALPARRSERDRPGREDHRGQSGRGAGRRAGGPTVLPHTTLVERGYKGQIYQTHGAATPDFVRLGGKAVEGTVMAASLMLVLDQVPDSNPAKKVGARIHRRVLEAVRQPPGDLRRNVYDAGLLLQRAVPEAAKKAKPGTPEFRAALRDALEATKELVGTQGVYNMTPQDHAGFDKRGRELMMLKNGAWTLIPE
jgi:branched-chain amino acid transport system substrate-binding protein